MVEFVVELAIGLIQGLGVVNPVGPTFIDDGAEHLVGIMVVQFWHYSFKQIFVASQHIAACRGHFVIFQRLGLIVEKTMGVSIPK